MKTIAILVAAFIVGVGSLVTSCSSTAVQSKPGVWENDIVFVTMHIDRDSTTGTRIINLKEIESAKGRLKRIMAQPDGESYLTVYVYRDTALVTSFRIEHPLCKDYETLHENDNLEHHHVDLVSEDFFFRVQLDGANHKIIMDEKFHNVESKSIITFQL